MTNDLHPFERADALTEQELFDVRMEVGAIFYGASWKPSPAVPGLYDVFAAANGNGLAVRKKHSDGNHTIVDNRIPYFSTNLDDAIKLAESVYAEFFLKRFTGGTWYANFSAWSDNSEISYTNISPTPALAICKAWLLWVKNAPQDAVKAAKI